MLARLFKQQYYLLNEEERPLASLVEVIQGFTKTKQTSVNNQLQLYSLQYSRCIVSLLDPEILAVINIVAS